MKDKKANRMDLHEAISKNSFQHAVISTFTFDPSFFEEYCLTKFDSLKNNPNITVITDSDTYTKAILAPEQYKPKQANLRYLLHPIRVPGAFHPKVSIFLNKKKGKLIIGSANFTRPGITSNAELVNCYTFDSENNTKFKWLFQSVFKFFLEISIKWPSDGLSSNLQAISRDVEWLAENEKSDFDLQFMHNIQFPIWDQFISGIETPVESLWVLSRYFDSKPDMLDNVMENLKPKKLIIYTQNGITTLNEKWLNHPLVNKGFVEVYLAQYKDDEHSQNLHAKALYIKSKNNSILLFGSANFTTPALFKRADKGNLEAVICLSGQDAHRIKPKELFDPLGSAVLITEKKMLQSAHQEESEYHITHKMALKEVILAGEKLKIKADLPEDIKKTDLVINLRFPNESAKSLKLINLNDDFIEVELSDNLIQRLGQSSTISRIESYENAGQNEYSNWLLVTNLLDINSGRSLRRERHIKEAQQSAGQFFEILKDLVSGNDEESLKTFLTFCDIPLLKVDRPRFHTGFRTGWDGDQGMRKLGRKNLKLFEDLHDAVINFFDRHYKKLNKHVEFGGLKGVGNFMHIWLSMGGILRMQIERAIAGFDSDIEPLTIIQWKTYRDHLDLYFRKFETLIN